MKLLEWWRDWRERRSALSEMDKLQLQDEAALMEQTRNPLNLAKLSVSAGDLAGGAVQWERARALVPNAVLHSADSVDILRGLKRYDEAEALMRESLKRRPGNKIALIGLAQIAEDRGDADEALKRWTVVRQRVQNTVEGFLGCARCLRDLGRFDEAEPLLNRALRLDPNNWLVSLERARLAYQRKDWAESLTRYKDTAEVHRYSTAFAFVAKTLIELDRIDEADAYLEEPARLFSSDLEIAVTHSQLAERRGDWNAAATRWARVRTVNPRFHTSYQQGARSLSKAGRHAEADAVLSTAIERFPDQLWAWQDFARLAHDRGDWSEAVPRWEALRERFPNEEAGYPRGAEALTALGRVDEAAALHQGP